jgi:hypothetical protein
LPTKGNHKNWEENREGFFNLVLAQWWHTHCVASIKSKFPAGLGRTKHKSQGGNYGKRLSLMASRSAVRLNRAALAIWLSQLVRPGGLEFMKPAVLIGIILIVLSILSFAYQGITYTTREKVLDRAGRSYS